MSVPFYVVPKPEDEFVEKILNKINAEFDAEFVTIKEESFAINGLCFENVAKKVTIDGGKIHFGWAIYKSQYICEAEKHAVWEDKTGNLIDITPNILDTKEILFVSDNQFNGIKNDNIRFNVTPYKLINDFIKLNELNGLLLEKYSTPLPNFKYKTPLPVLSIIEHVNGVISEYADYINSGKKLNMCHCGKFKNYINCHGKLAVQAVEDFIKNSF